MNRAAELRNIIARTEAALEFLPQQGEVIDFDLAIKGMEFDGEPKRDFTKDPMKFEIGMVFNITAPGHRGKKEHYRIYRIMEGVPHHTPIYGLCVDVHIVEEDARGNPNERLTGRFNEFQLNSYLNDGQMVITKGDQ